MSSSIPKLSFIDHTVLPVDVSSATKSLPSDLLEKTATPPPIMSSQEEESAPLTPKLNTNIPLSTNAMSPIRKTLAAIADSQLSSPSKIPSLTQKLAFQNEIPPTRPSSEIESDMVLVRKNLLSDDRLPPLRPSLSTEDQLPPLRPPTIAEDKPLLLQQSLSVEDKLPPLRPPSSFSSTFISSIPQASGNQLYSRTPSVLSHRMSQRAPSSFGERPMSSLGRPESQLSRQAASDNAPIVAGFNTAILTREIEDLKSKLKILENKRKQDQEKIANDSKDLQHVKNVAKRLELKLAPMHKEIKDLRGKLQDLENENATLAEDAIKTEEFLEMSALDKEMAEEKYENIILELEELKEKWEDLELECETLREENALYEGLREDIDEEYAQNAVVENIRLTKKNEQLKAALLKVRDMMHDQDSSYQEKIQLLEEDVNKSRDVSESFSKVKQQLAEAEIIIADLRLQLDNALGAEDMIESLTEKNLELQERIEELEQAIDELETLKSLNDELEANHLLTEKQLLEEVDELEDLHNLNREKLIQSQERNTYLESAVSKFKEVVSILESDLAELRSADQNTSADSVAMLQHTKSLMELNFKLNSTALEANTKAMELQLGKFEAQQALDQLSIVKCYLSDGYAADEVSIDALLRLDRIAFKSEIIETFLLERSESVSSNLSLVVEFTKIFMSLIDIKRYSSGLAYYIKSASIDEFQQCGIYFAQTEPAESVLSSIIDVLKEDSLQEQSTLRDLDNILHKLWMSYNEMTKSRGGTEPFHVLAINDLSTIQLSSRLVSEIFNEILTVFANDLEIDAENNSIITGIKTQLPLLLRLKVLIPRIILELESLYGDSRVLTKDGYDGLTRLSAKAKALVNYFYSVLQRLKLIATSEDEHSNESTIEIFKKNFQNVYDTESEESGGNITLLITEKLEELVNGIKTFSFTDDDLEDFEKPVPSWIQRETDLQVIKSNQLEREKEIGMLKAEVQRLATNVRARDKSVEELQVKLSVLDNKLAKSKEQVSKIKEVNQALSDAVAEGKRLQEVIASLRKALEDQNKQISKYKLSASNGKRDSSTGLFLNEKGFDRVAVSSLETEIKGLKSLVRYLSSRRPEFVNQATNKRQDDYSWLGNNEDLKKPVSLIFSPDEKQYRTRAYGLFTDIKKSLMEFDVVELSLDQNQAYHVDFSLARKVLLQRDTAEKIRLIVASLRM